MKKRVHSVFGDDLSSDDEEVHRKSIPKGRKPKKLYLPPKTRENDDDYINNDNNHNSHNSHKYHNDNENSNKSNDVNEVDKDIASLNEPTFVKTSTADESEDYLKFDLATIQNEHIQPNHHNNSSEDSRFQGLKYNALQRAKTESAMEKSLLAEQTHKSIGLSIMEKMGFKVGDTLGKDPSNGDVSRKTTHEPISVIVKFDKVGVGGSKNEKTVDLEKTINDLDVEGYKSRVSGSRKETKIRHEWSKLMKVCFDISGEEAAFYEDGDISKVNPLWRQYAIDRADKENSLRQKGRRVRIHDEDVVNNDRIEVQMDDDHSTKDDMTTLDDRNSPNDYPSSPSNDDPKNPVDHLRSKKEDPKTTPAAPSLTIQAPHDKLSGKKIMKLSDVTLDEVERNISTLLLLLRKEYFYCYYCGCKYADEDDMNSHCPGVTDDDHQ